MTKIQLDIRLIFTFEGFLLPNLGLIHYCQEIKKISAEKITLELLSSEWLTDFLSWLETNRKCSIATRNQRLAALHAFFRYIQAEEPAGILHFQKIIAIPIKKAKKPVVEYLTPDAIKILLKQPDKHTLKGRRDLTLISVLYDYWSTRTGIN